MSEPTKAVFLSYTSQDAEAGTGILAGGNGGNREVTFALSISVVSVASSKLFGRAKPA